ncbi:hypothetical protein Tco_0783274 [Tanacetum coccineum]
MMLKPKRLHDQDAETAIGVQNPFYLRKAKMAQPALYDGDEILKTHHVPVSVTLSEEDLELAKITRQKINDHVCMQKRMKSIPPNYFKENFIATFTPQTQLTPKQVFWSKDLLKQRAKDLKANAPPLPVLPPATMPMKAVFENLEAEVDQNKIDLKSGEIERKNLLITNEKISHLTKKNSDADPIFDLKALVSQNKDLTTKLNALQTDNILV